MKIGIDARFISEENIPSQARYSRNLIKEIARLDKENEYVIFKNPRYRRRVVDQGNFREVVIRSAPISLGTLIEFGIILKAQKLDVFHSHFYITPLVKACKQVVTVHDIIGLLFPRFYSGRLYILEKLALWFHKVLIPRAIRQSDRIIAPSEYTKECILQLVPDKPAESIDVIHEGTEPHFKPLASEEETASARKAHGLPDIYFFYVGNMKPNKNLVGLTTAFSIFLDSSPCYRDIRLIIAGVKDRFFPALHEHVASLKHGEKVIYRGYVPDRDLPAFYAGALALVFPSFIEGFGLPVLEAMACGAPVITSNTSSIPEIVGEAGILVDPNDTGGLAEAMKRVADDGALRKRLAARSLRRAGAFAWREAARQTIETYEKVLQSA